MSEAALVGQGEPADTTKELGRASHAPIKFRANVVGDDAVYLAADGLFSDGQSRQKTLARLPIPYGRRSGVFRRTAAAISRCCQQEVCHGRLVLFMPVFLGLGVILATDRATPVPFVALACALILSALATFFAWHRSLAARICCCGLTLVFAGMLRADFEAWRLATIILDRPVTTELTGLVERREVMGPGRWRYQIRVEKTEAPALNRPPERVTVVARNRLDSASIGDRVTGRARLSPPSGPALPGLNDFAFSAYFDGVGAVGYFYRPPEVLVGAKASIVWSQGISGLLFALRGAIGDRIRGIVGGDAGAFAAAIITDERRAISNETTEALRLSGLAHIVAISGLNMALAAGIFFVGLRFIFALMPGLSQALPVKKIAAGAALIMVTAYYLISGFGVSAERAYIMMAVILGAVILDRPSISLRNVGFSALIVIMLSPAEIFGPSFQMSFAATVALVAGYNVLARKPHGGEGRVRTGAHWSLVGGRALLVAVVGITLTSVIGSVSTLIFSVEHFHRFASYGLAANLAAMPIISLVVMPMALLAMLFMPFGADPPFLLIMGWGLEIVIAVARHVAAWGGDVPIGRQPATFLPLATVGFLLLTLLRTRLRYIGLILLGTAVLASSQSKNAPLPDLLIAEDGSLLALVEDGHALVNRAKPPAFLYDQWRRALRLDAMVPPEILPAGPSARSAVSNAMGRMTERVQLRSAAPELQPRPKRERLATNVLDDARRRMRQAQSGRFTCVKGAWCAAASYSGTIIALVEDGRYIGAACDVATLVVAANVHFDQCRSGALLLNGKTLRKTGALEISFNGMPQPEDWSFETAIGRNARPWERHRQYDWKSGTFDPSLPPALDTLIAGGSSEPLAAKGAGPVAETGGQDGGDDPIASGELLNDQW